MGHALVNKSVSNVVVGWHIVRCPAFNLGFSQLPIAAVREKVVGIARAHDSSAGQSKRDAGCVDGDPAPTPLLGDIGGCAGAASWVEYKVTGICSHEDATLDDFLRGLDNIYLSREPRIFPVISHDCCRKIREISFKANRRSSTLQSTCLPETFHTGNVSFPISPIELTIFKIEFKCCRFTRTITRKSCELKKPGSRFFQLHKFPYVISFRL